MVMTRKRAGKASSKNFNPKGKRPRVPIERKFRPGHVTIDAKWEIETYILFLTLFSREELSDENN